MVFTQYETGAELIKSIFINPGYTFMPVYSILLPDLNNSDILLVSSQCEVTNPYQYNAMMGHWLQLKHSTGILKISQACTSNLVPAMHHGVMQSIRNYKITQPLKNVVLEFIIYSASDASRKSDALIVEQGYGHLDAVLLR